MAEDVGQTQAFQADVARLLHLMVHSVYSEREIFLRELLSNASDACEKLRYEAVANAGLLADEAPFAIRLSLDKDAGQLTVADNGIGMSREDLTEALGTIARSGTRAFLDRVGGGEAASGDTPETDDADTGTAPSAKSDLIGQFGIGFYSAFMVADRVVVDSRRAGSEEAWSWTSDGKGTFAVAPLPLEAAPARGTRVILHLNQASKDYLEPWKVERVVSDHSSALAVPIEIVDKPGDEPRRLTDGAALWTRARSAITSEEYTEFYRSLAGQYDEPALTVHWRAEGRHEYTVLAFVPGGRPYDLFDPARKGRAKLYVRKVLISSDADVLPSWLRFVRLVVDSADIPLNVSREMVQESAVFAAIKKGVTNRVLAELTKLAETDAEAFGTLWDNFGSVIKEGLYEDPERRDAIFKIARFATADAPEGRRSLSEYVANLRENQTAIFYVVGDDVKRLASSPQLEGFRARGIDVLLLPDPVDAFWVSSAVGFDGKPFKSVTQGSADIKGVPLREGSKAPQETASTPKLATLFAAVKQELADVVEDVRASERLAESPVCLVAPESGLDRRLERMLAEHGQVKGGTKPVLELNAAHPLIEALSEAPAASDGFRDIVWLLFDEARLMEGEKPHDASHFAARLTRVLVKATQAAAPV